MPGPWPWRRRKRKRRRDKVRHVVVEKMVDNGR